MKPADSRNLWKTLSTILQRSSAFLCFPRRPETAYSATPRNSKLVGPLINLHRVSLAEKRSRSRTGETRLYSPRIPSAAPPGSKPSSSLQRSSRTPLLHDSAPFVHKYSQRFTVERFTSNRYRRVDSVEATVVNRATAPRVTGVSRIGVRNCERFRIDLGDTRRDALFAVRRRTHGALDEGTRRGGQIVASAKLRVRLAQWLARF